MEGATVSFLTAKLMGFLLNPSSLFIAGLGLSFLLVLSNRFLNAGRNLLALVLGCYVAFAMFPFGQWATNLLEDRFPLIQEHTKPVAGILVLGGSVSTIMTRERGQVSVGGNIERLTEFVRLSKLHPEAQLAYIGGQGRVFDRKPTEAEVSKRFLDEIGMDTTTVWFEDKSRNTEEGAYASFAHLSPGNKPWILITSASHMPRAVGLFRKAGWTIVAHPVDFKTLPGGQMTWTPKWPGSLGYINGAIYEWAGLVFAWMRGKIDEVFPGPSLAPRSGASPN